MIPQPCLLLAQLGHGVCRTLNQSDPRKLDAALKNWPIENILKFILEDELHQIDAYSVEERMPFVRHLNEVQRIISPQCLDFWDVLHINLQNGHSLEGHLPFCHQVFG
ncbi:hypothetical protein EK904_006063 [Melospiza melodia maxima]|nr:hypothetical protein EK904_006063 [Melospiza melodia maxima]